MPLVGPLLLIGGLLFAFVRDGRVALAVALALSLLLAIGTHVRNRDYADETRLWMDNVAKHPGEPRGHLNLGVLLANKGDYDEALESTSRAIELEPRFQRAYVTRGSVQVKLGNLHEALQDFNTGLSTPSSRIRFAPDYGRCFELRGAVLVDLGRSQKAIKDLDRVIRVKPELASPYYHRGRAYASIGQFGPAFNDFERAISLAPKHFNAHNNLAWLLATCPDSTFRSGQLAVEHARIACEHFEWQNVPALDTMAAAFARNGDFEAAARWQEQAIELADQAEVQDLTSRLVLYQRGEAYSEEAPE